MASVSEIVAQIVADHTTEVFAIMGNGNAYFTDALARQNRVRITSLRHETACVASADAYYRVARKIAVATTTFGPGYTNALTSLGEAVVSRTPLVYVVGGQPSTGPRPWDVDQVALAEAVGAVAMTLSQTNVADQVRQAFAQTEKLRKPVVVFIPMDLATAEASDEPSAETTPADLTQEQLHPESAVDLQRWNGFVAKSNRPLVLAGRGARTASSHVKELADRLGALTVATAPARGIFSGREYDLGVCGGFASEASSDLIKQADLVVAIGASLNQFTTAFNTQFAEDAVIVRIDLPGHQTYPKTDLLIEGNAETVVPALIESLPSYDAENEPWDGQATKARSSKLTFDRPQGEGTVADGLLDPRSAVVKLNEILPADRQIVSDGGHFIGWSSYYLDLPAPDSLVLVGTHYQSIGLGFPSAPGAIIARPDTFTAVFTGDGGGLMGIADLDSVVRTAKRAMVVVFNDACYGAEIHQYGAQGLDEEIMEIDQADFVSIGRGFGADGVVVRTMEDFKQVEEWVQQGNNGTLIVDLRISREVVAPYIEEIRELTLKRK